MNSDPDSVKLSKGELLQSLLDELGRQIGRSQSALLGGSFRDLESFLPRQSELCARIYALLESSPALASAPMGGRAGDLQQQNGVFRAVIRRMLRHHEMLRHLLGGPSITYSPAAEATAGQVR